MTEPWKAAREEGRRERWVLSSTLVASLAFHLASFALLPLVADAGTRSAGLAEVEVQVVAPEPEPLPEPEPEPEEAEPEPVEPEPEPPPPRPVRRAEPETPPPPAPEPDPAPAEETPVDFSGLTLTNEGGDSGWSSAVGDGTDREGPIGAPGQTTGRRREGSPDGAPGGTGRGPALVSPENLSRAPRPPPNLDRLLDRYYPEEAKEAGVEGVARVRIRIGPDGAVRVLRRLTERPAGRGFLAACAEMLRASPDWTPPYDANGTRVATADTFTCRFTVRY